MRMNHDKYEYFAFYVDDLAVAMKDPKAFIGILETKYKFKTKDKGEWTHQLPFRNGLSP
jgi:hypothetical protein